MSHRKVSGSSPANPDLPPELIYSAALTSVLLPVVYENWVHRCSSSRRCSVYRVVLPLAGFWVSAFLRLGSPFPGGVSAHGSSSHRGCSAHRCSSHRRCSAIGFPPIGLPPICFPPNALPLIRSSSHRSSAYRSILLLPSVLLVVGVSSHVF